MASAASPTPRSRIEHVRGAGAIAWGVGATVAGLIVALFGNPDIGAVGTLIGVLLSVLGVHRLGRGGPDAKAITGRRDEESVRT